MGLILDSSAVIAAERRGDTPAQFVQNVISVAGDQEAALSSVGRIAGSDRIGTAEAVPFQDNISPYFEMRLTAISSWK